MIKWLFTFLPFLVGAQSFAPEPGTPGSTAVHKDSAAITFWAGNLFVERGPLDIADPNLGVASFGTAQDGEGKADGLSVVSLGDGGIATYFFAVPITNDAGPDFAVFENGFMDHYLELAFVEVSSDGQNYVRFDAVSEIQTDVQLSNFDTVNCRNVHNLAGKYRANYGTPFDLDELSGAPGLDIQNITSIRIVDVVGTIDSTYAHFDSQGSRINDPYPTPYPSCGFDLDGLALLQPYVLAVETTNEVAINCYPNPVKDVLYIDAPGTANVCVYDVFGKCLYSGENSSITVTDWKSGTYTVVVSSEENVVRKRLVKL